MIEEDVQDAVAKILAFGVHLLDHVDPTEKLSHVAFAAAVLDSGYRAWRTRSEHNRSRNSITMTGSFRDDTPRVTLSPPHRSRASFRQQHQEIATDIVVLLRRQLTQ